MSQSQLMRLVISIYELLISFLWALGNHQDEIKNVAAAMGLSSRGSRLVHKLLLHAVDAEDHLLAELLQLYGFISVGSGIGAGRRNAAKAVDAITPICR